MVGAFRERKSLHHVHLGETHQQGQPFLLHCTCINYFDIKAESKSVQFLGKLWGKFLKLSNITPFLPACLCWGLVKFTIHILSRKSKIEFL